MTNMMLGFELAILGVTYVLTAEEPILVMRPAQPSYKRDFTGKHIII